MAAILPAVLLASDARADDNALAPYRDRFRLGMDKYKAGSVAEAIRIWTAIYEAIGPQRGYRLSFDLARAYDAEGDATRAVERYRSFLDEVGARRTGSETIDPLVEHEATDADERLTALNREHGRIEVVPTPLSTLAQVDQTDPRLGSFTAYVAPGKHVVTFGPGQSDNERIEVDVAAGEVVVARSTRPVPAPALDVTPVPPEPVTKRVLHHPFSPVVLYAGAIAAAGTIAAPVLAYEHAYSLINTYQSTNPSVTVNDKNNAYASYNGARTFAYTMLAIPITLGVTTGALTTWYFAATEEREVKVSVGVYPAYGGGGASIGGAF
jgi:hypothetical protein